MGFFEGWIDLDNAAKDFDLLIARVFVMTREFQGRVDEALAKRLAASLQEIRRGIVRQELAPVELHRGGERLWFRRCDSSLELGDIDPDVFAQLHYAALDANDVVAGDSSQLMKRAVQVIGTSFEVFVGPQPVDDFLAVEQVTRGQRQRGYQLNWSSTFPCRSGNRLLAVLNSKPSE
jgi:hypothetical protein